MLLASYIYICITVADQFHDAPGGTPVTLETFKAWKDAGGFRGPLKSAVYERGHENSIVMYIVIYIY